jgi:glycosyltransferase involved in cell wall biosynthesis
VNSNLPLISIITPSLNSVNFISEAVESVIYQSYPNFEHIIVDGNSTDGTLEALQKYSHLSIWSEADGGLYEAINRGICLAKGDIIGFLNSDDLYEYEVFAEVVEKFLANPDTLAILGGAKVFKKDFSGKQSIITSYSAFPPQELLLNSTLGTPIFNAWFFQKRLFNVVGLLNTSYRYSSDRDFIIRLALYGLNYLCINRNVYLYRFHPNSLTNNDSITGKSGFILEDRDIAEKYIYRNSISSSQKSLFRSWHSRTTINQIKINLKLFNFKNAFVNAGRGLRYNPWWPFLFVSEMVSSIFRLVLNNEDFEEDSKLNDYPSR